jgi:hypothetical protein
VSDEPIIQDTSRVDNYLRSRHRVEVLNAAWKPALAGAAGAVAIIGAVVVGVWLATPRFTYREVEIPKVTYRDVTVPNVVTKDLEIPIPRVVAPPPTAANPPSPPSDAPKTPAERKFTETPAYKGAQFKGRIVASRSGGAVSFEGGQDFFPAHWDEQTEQSVYDTDQAFETDGLVGDLAACVQDEHSLWHCTAEHDGRTVNVGLKQKTARVSPPAPAPSDPTLMPIIYSESARHDRAH